MTQSEPESDSENSSSGSSSSNNDNPEVKKAEIDESVKSTNLNDLNSESTTDPNTDINSETEIKELSSVTVESEAAKSHDIENDKENEDVQTTNKSAEAKTRDDQNINDKNSPPKSTTESKDKSPPTLSENDVSSDLKEKRPYSVQQDTRRAPTKVDDSRAKDRDKNDRRKQSNDKYDRGKREEHRRRRSRSPRKRSRSRSRQRRPRESDTKVAEDKTDEKNAAAEKTVDPEIIPRRQQRTVDILTSKTGGAYIPPAKLRLLQAEITDKSSAAYQRIAWEALKKSIHGYINKVNVDNIGIITRELLKENIVRGRGLLCRSIIQAQAASPTFTHVYAALVAVINSKFPNIGELLLKRLVIQFKRGFRRNDKPICLSSSRFVAHLVNQRAAHEILALEILTLLVETPTDDSVEVAIAFLKECGMKLQEVSSKGVNAIFEMLKNILHEGKLDKRVQYMIEVVFQVRKDGFKDHIAVAESLELVEEDDQFTHLIMLDEATDPQDVLNVFKFDDQYEDNENKYKGLSKELLGSDASDSDNDSDGSGSDSNSDDDNDEEEAQAAAEKQELIIDQTETNLVALRRTIYLTIHSSLDYEECAHKLMKMELKPGQEMELCHMFLDCCAEQRTYEKFYGLLAQRFCMINKIYIPPFEEIFKDTYTTTHRLDTNRLRNVSKFFAHLLFTDAIGWDVIECIHLNEDDTTSSSRIFIKILFQELAEYMGLGKLNARLKDATIQEAFSGMFPRDNPRNTRFAINFFTSIGLGGLTDELREHLKNAPKIIPPPVAEVVKGSESSSDSSSSSSSSSSDSSSSSSSDDSSSSDSDSGSSSSNDSDTDSSADKRKKSKKTKKSKKDDKRSHKRAKKRKSVSESSDHDDETSKRKNRKRAKEQKKSKKSRKQDEPMKKSNENRDRNDDREKKRENGDGGKKFRTDEYNGESKSRNTDYGRKRNYEDDGYRNRDRYEKDEAYDRKRSDYKKSRHGNDRD